MDKIVDHLNYYFFLMHKRKNKFSSSQILYQDNVHLINSHILPSVITSICPLGQCVDIQVYRRARLFSAFAFDLIKKRNSIINDDDCINRMGFNLTYYPSPRLFSLLLFIFPMILFLFKQII